MIGWQRLKTKNVKRKSEGRTRFQVPTVSQDITFFVLRF